MPHDGDLLKKFVQEDYGLQGNGNWFRGVDHDSLVIDYNSGVFYWNSRDIIGDAEDYLVQVRGYSKSDAEKYLRTLNREGVPKAIYEYNNKEEDVVMYDRLVSALWKNGKNHREYWYDRLLTDDTIDRFQLGYFNGWYTIPFFYGDELMNIQKRRDEPEKRIMAWYRGVPLILFNRNILGITKKVIITEGIVDAILLSQFGLPAVSKIGGAHTWNDDWLEIFDEKNRLFIVFDNDGAGRNGAKRMARKLGEYRCKIYTFDGYEKNYDVIDFFRDGGNLDEFKKLIFEKSKFSFEL